MRVLNLWQKNEVFPTDVIQQLMALAPNPGKLQHYMCPIFEIKLSPRCHTFLNCASPTHGRGR